MVAGAPIALLIGTRAGLFRWHGGSLAPIGTGSDAITALAPLPGSQVAAATERGRLLRVRPDGAVAAIDETPGSESIASLHWVPGPASRTAGTLLVGTAAGRLLASDDLGATFHRVEPLAHGTAAPLVVVGIPGRPRSALLLVARREILLLADPSGALEPWHADGTDALVQLAADPGDAELWLARATHGVARSRDGARTFAAVAGWPAGLRPRALHVAAAPRPRVVVVAWPGTEPPDPSDPSPLWLSADAGLCFHPVASRLVDRARDPSGELTTVASWRERDGGVLAFGTDRGEILAWSDEARPARLLADGLPPIETLLAAPTDATIDPSTSGIHLLP